MTSSPSKSGAPMSERAERRAPAQLLGQRDLVRAVRALLAGEADGPELALARAQRDDQRVGRGALGRPGPRAAEALAGVRQLDLARIGQRGHREVGQLL